MPSRAKVAPRPTQHGGTRLECLRCGKSAYPTEVAAERAARKVLRGAGTQLSVYHDPRCDWYHLSTQATA